MTDPLPSKEKFQRNPIVEAAGIAHDFIQYAYEQGMHEIGIDPIAVLMGEIERLTEALQQREDQLRHALDADRAAEEPNALSEAWDSVDALIAFAYEQGFHELGYDPAKVIADEIVRLKLREQQLSEALTKRRERIEHLQRELAGFKPMTGEELRAHAVTATREPPHCASCSCPPYDALALQIERLQEQLRGCSRELAVERRASQLEKENGATHEPGLKLPDDPRELLVTTARDAGFSDYQWKAMFYEQGPYDVTFPCFTTKKFIALLLERLQPSPPPGDG